MPSIASQTVRSSDSSTDLISARIAGSSSTVRMVPAMLT